MFKGAGRLARFRLIHRAAHIPRSYGRSTTVIAASAATAVVAASFLLFPQHVYNDSMPLKSEPKRKAYALADSENPESLDSAVWGSNKSKTLDPSEPTSSFPVPSDVPWLHNVALRDLALHESHAALVDARGDVYQWGDGFATRLQKPILTLSGKDIVSLQLTRNKLYALSSSGQIFILSSKQDNDIASPGSSSPVAWLWGRDRSSQGVVQVQPREQLGWREKVVEISAGRDHLLARTSNGRVFTLPISKKANSHGQLALRKVEFVDSVSGNSIPVDLIPKSPQPGALSDIDDQSIKFCTTLFEVPSLKGLTIVQVAAGSRSSFVRTADGQLLAYGANEFGQLGLGTGQVPGDIATIPHEIDLTRNTPRSVTTKCTSIAAGGDLTAFTVERSSRDQRTIEVLMCGNGQYGGLGNSMFTTASFAPSRVKNVSGLSEYNDTTNKMDLIAPHRISLSPTGHALLTLETIRNGGRDLLIWGRNLESELGNGKKSSLAVPTMMSQVETDAGERVMLRRKRVKEVLDMQGRRWGRNVWVEQRPAAGYNCSAIFWAVS